MSEERPRPHLNVTLVGHVEHGKTMLAAALSRVLAKHGPTRPRAYAELLREPGYQQRTVSPAHLAIETAQRHYAIADCPGMRPRLKNAAWGSACADGTVLVVSALESVMPQTREHLLVALEQGARHVVVFINKCDLVEDPDLVDIAEMEVRQLLASAGLAGDEVRVIRGAALPAHDGDAAWEQPVLDLAGALDAEIPTPERVTEGPARIALREVHRVRGQPQRVIVVGHIASGAVKKGDRLEIVGPGLLTGDVQVEDLEVFDEKVESASAGDYLGLQLRFLSEPNLPRRGSSLVGRGGAGGVTAFTCDARVLEAANGGRHTPVRSGHMVHFHFHTTGVTGVLTLPDDLPQLAPGASAEDINVTLDRPTLIEEGMTFTFKDGSDGLRRLTSAPRPLWGGVAGMGVVTRTYG